MLCYVIFSKVHMTYYYLTLMAIMHLSYTID